MVGHLRAWKGQHVALAAIDALAAPARAGVRLWIVGDAPESEQTCVRELRRFAGERGLDGAVAFLGFRPTCRS